MFLKWLWRRTMDWIYEQLDAVGYGLNQFLAFCWFIWVICFGILYLFCYLGGIGIGPDEYYVGWWDTTLHHLIVWSAPVLFWTFLVPVVALIVLMILDKIFSNIDNVKEDYRRFSSDEKEKMPYKGSKRR